MGMRFLKAIAALFALATLASIAPAETGRDIPKLPYAAWPADERITLANQAPYYQDLATIELRKMMLSALGGSLDLHAEFPGKALTAWTHKMAWGREYFVEITKTGFLLPYGVLILVPYFDSIPQELDDAARIDGCSRFSAYSYGDAKLSSGDAFSITVDTTLATGGDDRMTIVDSLGMSHVATLGILGARTGRGFLEANNVQVDFDYFVAYAIR